MNLTKPTRTDSTSETAGHALPEKGHHVGTDTLDAALALADMGLSVFPCWECTHTPAGEPCRWCAAGKPSRVKQPRTRHGFKEATTDAEQIREWWGRWPRALIGAPVPGHLVVFDLDPRHGGTLDALTAVTGPLPTTLTTVSGRGDGGAHLWFRAPGVPLSQKRFPEGIDLRSPGRHYLIVPPSLHPVTGRPYRWDLSIPAAELPARAVGALRTPEGRRTIHAPAYSPHGETRAPNPAGLLRWVATASTGERNGRLYRAARKFIDEHQPEPAYAALADAACAAGLDMGEATRTIRSAQRGSGSHPLPLG